METEVCWRRSLWEAGRAADPPVPGHDAPSLALFTTDLKYHEKQEEGASRESSSARKSR